jgi:hypothetical protein
MNETKGLDIFRKQRIINIKIQNSHDNRKSPSDLITVNLRIIF